MQAHPKLIYLPDTMANWPWPRAINPHYEAVKIEADAWYHSFKTMDPESLTVFDKSNAGSSYVTSKDR